MRMNGPCPTSAVTLSIVSVVLFFLLPASPCSMLDSSCFNISRCSQGFTFYIQPLTHKQHLHYLTTTSENPPELAASPDPASQASMHHRCRRIWASNTSNDNLETWGAECLAFVIREYFQVVEDPRDACVVVPSFDTSCTCSNCVRQPSMGLSQWEVDTAAALQGMPHWDEGRNHLLLNLDLDTPDPGLHHGFAILMRSSWMRPFYRADYDVQLPLVKAGLLLPIDLRQRLDSLHAHSTNAASTPGKHHSEVRHRTREQQQQRSAQHHLGGRSCWKLAQAHGDVCEASSFAGRGAKRQLHALHPYTAHSTLQLSLAMESLLDDIIAARPTVGPHNSTLLLYFRGALYPNNPAYERRTVPLGKLVSWLGTNINTLCPINGHVIVIDGLCTGSWQADSGLTIDPAMEEILRFAPHCARCMSHMRVTADGQVEPCDVAAGLPSYEQGMAAARFVLAPGGQGSQSYRVLEAMLAGSVPVVVSDDAVAPYDGEGFLGQLWDSCVLSVKSEDITSLPDFLLGMAEAQYRGHLQACLLLLGEREVFVSASIVHGLCIVAARLAKQMGKGSDWLGPAARWCGAPEV